MNVGEEAPGRGSGSSGGGGRSDQGISFHKGARPSIEFYEGGVRTCLGAWCPNSTGKGGATRGRIKGWSTASRRRFREWLLCWRPPAGWLVYSGTFTIPGPVAAVSEMKHVWDTFRTWVKNQGWCGTWRLEVQTRGALHWHVILGVPADLAGAEPLPCMTSDQIPGARLAAVADRVWPAWLRAVDELGRVPRSGWRGGCPRSRLPGARRHAVELSNGAYAEGAWLRYLQDHASKRKQGQVGEGIGRHWGVINKGLYRRALAVRIEGLSDREWHRFLRAFQRLTTPGIPAACVFGRKRGRRSKRGAWGSAVWFSRPATVARLLAWAKGGLS